MSENKENYKTVTNPATGSTFYVIAETESLILSARWFMDWDKENSAWLAGVRVRITPAEGFLPLNLSEYVAANYPDFVQAGKSDNHVSTSVMCVIPLPFWMVGDVEEAIRDAGVISKMYEAMVKATGGAISMSVTNWVALMDELLAARVKELASQQGGEKKVSAKVVSLFPPNKTMQ